VVLPREKTGGERVVLPREPRQSHHQRADHPASPERKPERPLLRLSRLRQKHRHSIRRRRAR
jgi:hypothetical protein